ncbi:hypothetical protein ACIPUO_06330 [Pectobacterium carotovorum]|uniref:hypothetical protein n=1 Tax=Pectobacterium carotovorum TaxID=554 RepID=UPI0037FC5595
MKKIILIFFALILLGCKPNTDKVVSVAESELSQYLVDPESAKFKDSIFYPEKDVGYTDQSGYVCGLVNAKNSFGGYTGFQPYYIHVLVKTRFLIPVLGVLHGSREARVITEKDIKDKVSLERVAIDYRDKCPSNK